MSIEDLSKPGVWMGDRGDTICALSTAPGRAGIAVVRISGPESLKLLGGVFIPDRKHAELPARYAMLGRIQNPRTGEELDQALATFFPSPNSYTGEDVIEISVHGSPVLITSLLDGLCASGARLAEPGEFTMRAFLSGRMDLSQAEAVRDIIEANSIYQVQIAARQRSGELSRQLEPLRKLLMDIAVNLESAVEFVEDDLPLESRTEVARKLEEARGEVAKWVDSFRRGRIVRNGFNLAIVGRPNVGKSSLFNSILVQDRSIVTEIPGTTRDLVSEFICLEGIPVRLVDTAGVQDSSDKVEQMGVDRSLSAIADADAILLVVDRSEPPSAEDERLRRRLAEYSCIVVLNKSDIPAAWTPAQKLRYADGWPLVEVSAKTGEHLETLRTAIRRHLFGGEDPGREGILITNLRHCRCLEAVQGHLSMAARALCEGLSEEFVLFDLHKGLEQLGAITGETSVEDVLGEIFSRFCIGK